MIDWQKVAQDLERENKELKKQLAKREWVWLTKDEANSWELPDCPTVFEFCQFIEAKIKEKNHIANAGKMIGGTDGNN